MTRSPNLALALAALVSLATGSASAAEVHHAVVMPGGTGSSQVSSFAWVSDDDGDGLPPDRREVRIERKDSRMSIVTEPQPDKAWLGVLLDAGDGGIIVRGVATDSPAAQAGLQAGDLVTAVDGRPVDEDDLGSLVGDHRPGDRVKLTVRRDGKEQEIAATLQGHPGRMSFELSDDQPGVVLSGDLFRGLEGLSGADGLAGLERLHELEGLKALQGKLAGIERLGALRGLDKLPRVPCVGGDDDDCFAYAFLSGFARGPRLGVSVEPLSEQLASYFGIEPGGGLLVTETVADGAAAQAGIQAGDVLLSIGGTPVKRAIDIRRSLADAEAGSKVTVEVMRRGKRRTLDVTVPTASDDAAAWRVAPGLFDFQKQGWVPGASEEAQRAIEKALAEAAAADQGDTRAGLERALQALREAEASRAADADRLQQRADELERRADELRRQAEQLEAQRQDEERERDRQRELQEKELQRQSTPPTPGPSGLPL